MVTPGRSFSAGTQYRYGFNGKENDKNISDGAQDYGMRINDVRLGRFLSVDPISVKYPELTPYQFASNTPIQASDLDGLEANFEPAKVNRISYEQVSDVPIFNALYNGKTMGANMGISAWNQTVGTAEDLTNLAFSSKGRDQVMLKTSNAAMTGIRIYGQYLSGQVSQAQLLKMGKDYLSNPENIENLVGGIVGAFILDKGIGLIGDLKVNPKP